MNMNIFKRIDDLILKLYSTDTPGKDSWNMKFAVSWQSLFCVIFEEKRFRKSIIFNHKKLVFMLLPSDTSPTDNLDLDRGCHALVKISPGKQKQNEQNKFTYKYYTSFYEAKYYPVTKLDLLTYAERLTKIRLKSRAVKL